MYLMMMMTTTTAIMMMRPTIPLKTLMIIPTITVKTMMMTTVAPESNGLCKRREVVVCDVSRDVASLKQPDKIMKCR